MPAIQLVAVDANGRLYVPDDADKVLSRMDQPLAIVGIAGKYRSGKSTLISRLVGEKAAFRVGHSVNSCTKGIMAHEATIKLRDGRQVLVLDSEGLNALDSNIQHDVRIFALSVLLSSVFVYNVTGTLDESTLSSLKVVTDFVQLMKSPDEDDNATIANVAGEMPKFVTVVRDFALKLERPNGSKLTADEWLEDALNPRRNTPDKEQSSNEVNDQVNDKVTVRQTICRIFPDRKCFTLPRPSTDDAVLTRMDTANDDELRPEFNRAMSDLRSHIIEHAPAKHIMGQSVTGIGLLHIARQLVAAINDSRTPQIRDSWVLLGQIRAKEAASRALKQMIRVSSKWVSCTMPLRDLRRALKKLKSQTLSKYNDETCESEPSDVSHSLHADIDQRVDELVSVALERLVATARTNLVNATERVKQELAQQPEMSAVDRLARVQALTHEADNTMATLLQELDVATIQRILAVSHTEFCKASVFDLLSHVAATIVEETADQTQHQQKTLQLLEQLHIANQKIADMQTETETRFDQQEQSHQAHLDEL